VKDCCKKNSKLIDINWKKRTAVSKCKVCGKEYTFHGITMSGPTVESQEVEVKDVEIFSFKSVDGSAPITGKVERFAPTKEKNIKLAHTFSVECKLTGSVANALMEWRKALDPKVRRIALLGKSGSGKDTVFKFLQDFGFNQISIAKRIKDIVADLYGFPREWCDDRDKKFKVIPEWGCSPVDLLQCLALDFRKVNGDKNRDVLCLDAIKKFNNLDQTVVTDCRYISDVIFFKERDYKIVKVLGKKREDKIADQSHQSEAEMETDEMDKLVDIFLENIGTLDELKAKVVKLYDGDLDEDN
jgi:hypothetical protein